MSTLLFLVLVGGWGTECLPPPSVGFCVVYEKMESGLVTAAPGLSGLCQSLNGPHDPLREG